MDLLTTALVPADVRRGRFTFRVVTNAPLCADHFRLVLRSLGGALFPPARAGQFVQLAIGDEPADEVAFDGGDEYSPPRRRWRNLEPAALLRRAFAPSACRIIDDATEIELIYRVVGVGTGAMSQLAGGDRVTLIGPLGRPFALPPAGTPAVLVGGGVGIPPMIYLAAELAAGERPAVAICGATRRSLLPLTIDGERVGEFDAVGIPCMICTDDGSLGFRGFVTQAMERHLDAHPHERPWLYACGPEPMLRRVADIAAARGLHCQVAVERAMACGMGTCQSCVIRTIDASARDGWRYTLACTDGPVFDAATLRW